jgi:HSP20 family molecular chaperone IbpA
MVTRWKQYRVGKTLKREGDQIPFDRDDDWAYKVARYVDMRVNQADYGVNILPVDLYENDTGFVIQAPAVGIKPDGVDIQCQEDVLVIRAKIDENNDKAETSIQIIGERPHGLFARRHTLPGPVCADHASARVENGLLTVQLTRSSENGSKRVHIIFADPSGELMASSD